MRALFTSMSLFVAFTWTSAGVRAQAPDQHAEEQAERPAEPEDETLLALSAGAVLNTGNARSFSGSLGARFNIKRFPHMLSLEAAGVYGRAATRQDDGSFGPATDNARNVSGRARYDFFLSENDAVFGVERARHDPFAGLDVRLQTQVGYSRRLLNQDEGKHVFLLEAGYDLTYDNLTSVDDTMPAAGDDVFHSARAFAGYDNHVSETFRFRSGLEALFDVEESSNWRLESVSELGAKVAGAFEVGVNFTLRYDHQPVAGADELDTITTLNLLYTIDWEKEDEPAAAETPAPAPAAEPPAPCVEDAPAPVSDDAPADAAEPPTPADAPAAVPESSAPVTP